MTDQEYIEDTLKEFDEEFTHKDVMGIPKIWPDQEYEGLKSFLSSKILAFSALKRKEIEGMKKENYDGAYGTPIEEHLRRMAKDEAYQDALALFGPPEPDKKVSVCSCSGYPYGCWRCTKGGKGSLPDESETSNW